MRVWAVWGKLASCHLHSLQSNALIPVLERAHKREVWPSSYAFLLCWQQGPLVFEVMILSFSSIISTCSVFQQLIISGHPVFSLLVLFFCFVLFLVCVCVCVGVWPRCMVWEMLVPRPGIENRSSAVKEHSSNHWTARKSPHWLSFGNFKAHDKLNKGFPGGTGGEEPACQCRRQKRHGFDPWVGNIPCRMAWKPTPVFLPAESHGQRSLVGYNPRAAKSWTQLKQISTYASWTYNKYSNISVILWKHMLSYTNT